jgi:hypothetical protein
MLLENNLKKKVLLTLDNNRDGSLQTQKQRKHILLQICNELSIISPKKVLASNLGADEYRLLANYWLNSCLNAGTIKNRFSCLRWLNEKLGLDGFSYKEIPANKELGIIKRRNKKEINSALDINLQNISKLSYEKQLAVRLVLEFGLNKTESLLFNLHEAYIDDFLKIKKKWTKNRKGRIIPIMHPSQAALIEDIRLFSGKKHLFSQKNTYEQNLWQFDSQLRRNGLNKICLLRNIYMQNRYKAITGWESPLNGGITRKELTLAQRELDDKARIIISQEMGYTRSDTTKNYIG